MKLMLIDGNSLINRAFYGVRPLTSDSGVPTNAIYGFLNMLFKLRTDIKPDEICICFDLPGKTFRHQAYDEYKAGRKPMPDDLAVQIPLLKEALDFMGIARMEAQGFEADDLLGTLARVNGEQGGRGVIVTGDRDSLQFISDSTTVALVTTKAGQTLTEELGMTEFAEKYRGLTPDKMVDLKAIMGDSSDNIPGIKGIGEKGALDLLERFGSLDGVYAGFDSDQTFTPSVRKKLEEGRQSAYMSYSLAKGECNAPIDKLPGTLAPTDGNPEALFALLDRLSLRSIVKKLGLTGSFTSETADDAVPPPHRYDYIETAAELTRFSSSLDGQALGCALSDDLSMCAVTLRDKTAVFCEDRVGKDCFSQVLTLLFAPGNKTSVYSALPHFTALLYRGFDISPVDFDVSIAYYLLHPGSTERYIPTGWTEVPAIYNEGDAFTLLGISEEALGALSVHSQLAAQARLQLLPKLEKDGLLPLYRDIELPLTPVLASMQSTGMAIDRARLSTFGEGLRTQIAQLEENIYQIAGYRFNVGSTKQLATLLYDELGLRAGKKTKTGRSTDAETLERLSEVHEIIPLILQWRKHSKLVSTYVDGLVKVIGEDGRIHSTFNQTVTATGRLSSTEPNMQNIPIRREDGSEVRRSFVASPGCILLDADYSQIELRILAHMANDTVMLTAFANGEDIHTVTASQVFGVPTELVTSQMRSRAKAVNFGIVYGISAFSLSQDIDVPVKEAQSYIDAYLAKYIGVKNYMDEVKRKAHEDGFVTTLYGRRRALPELKSSNFNLRSFGERVALNMPIQGTSADIIKIAMINVAQRFKEQNMSSRLILQVHDELIVEAPEAERAQASEILHSEMEGAASLSVRLLAEVSAGVNWYDSKK